MSLLLRDYFVVGRFNLTQIICSWAVTMGRKARQQIWQISNSPWDYIQQSLSEGDWLLRLEANIAEKKKQATLSNLFSLISTSSSQLTS